MTDLLGSFLNVSYEINNFSTPIDLGLVFNSHAGGVGFTGILVAIWLIGFLTLKSREIEHSMIVSSFGCVIFSGILYLAGLITDANVITAFGMLALSIFTLLLKD